MLNDIFNILLPHVTIFGFIIILLGLGMCLNIRKYKYSRFAALTGIVFSIFLLSTVQTEPQCFGFNNSLMSDSYTLLFEFMILACGFLCIILSRNIVRSIKRHAYTFHAIFLSAILGGISVVSSNDFLTLFISMELMGFATYFLIASQKGYCSKEASFKYLIMSAVSSGIFLFGVSYMYGITGSLNFSDIYEKVASEEQSILYTMSSILITLGLISKLAVFPFANWIIDIYKGSETSVLAFLSTIPKLAIFAILCRLLVFPLGSSFTLTILVIIISLFTALWANTYAVRENNVKVILACSSSANASYMLLAASLVSVYNLSTVIFYLICCVFMDIAAFAFLNIYGDDKKMMVEHFKGIFHKNHGLCGAYCVAILALAGIPITSGFIAKIYLFSAIAKSGFIFIPFLVILLILTVVALFYYLKILLPLFDECDKNTTVPTLKAVFSQKFVLIIASGITLLIGLFPEKLIEICNFIAYNI